MERRVVVDLLPDRTQETLATWLKEHPGVEIVSRDRAEAYASGIREGTPEAQQVADRWHLAKNLGQTLEKLLETKGALLKQALNSGSEGTSPDNNAPPPPKVEASEPETARQTRQEERLQILKQSRRQSRLEQYEEVRALFPERKERAPRPCRIDAYKPYITERWREGCHNGAALHEEIRQRGYKGGYTSLREYVRSLRHTPDPSQLKPREKASPRQITFWMLRRAGDRTARQQSILDTLSQLCVPFQVASGLASRFLYYWRLRVSNFSVMRVASSVLYIPMS